MPILDSQQITVTYGATAVETLFATLTITTHSPITPVLTVNVIAETILPPIITVTPSVVEETLNSGEIRDVGLTISNTGNEFWS